MATPSSLGAGICAHDAIGQTPVIITIASSFFTKAPLGSESNLRRLAGSAVTYSPHVPHSRHVQRAWPVPRRHSPRKYPSGDSPFDFTPWQYTPRTDRIDRHDSWSFSKPALRGRQVARGRYPSAPRWPHALLVCR